MYISILYVNTGNNPDRPRPGLKWLGNIYHVHQRLSMAFMKEQIKTDDSLFLKPFNPENIQREKFLYRIDNSINLYQSRACILVQSVVQPDWEYAFKNAKYLLADMPFSEPKLYNPEIKNDELYRFRININLSKKSKEFDNEGNKRIDRVSKQGKRVSLIWDKEKDRNEVIKDWFNDKITRKDKITGNDLGFELIDFNVIFVGWINGWKKSSVVDHHLKFRSALIEGNLKVSNSELFIKTLKDGIGSAKSFGFGLLSLAKIE